MEHVDANASSLVSNEKNRTILTKAFFGILKNWNLTNDQEAKLLGWSYGQKRSKIDALKKGGAMEDDQDKLDRIREIINIHKNLRMLFPYQNDLAYQWIHEKRERFGNHTALDVMMEDGLLGIKAIRRYLDHVRTS